MDFNWPGIGNFVFISVSFAFHFMLRLTSEICPDLGRDEGGGGKGFVRQAAFYYVSNNYLEFKFI